jgi:predicted AlkP superfamily pyrophosphatase or phosphodiesterase
MHRTLVLNVVGLSPRLLGEHTPALSTLCASGGARQLTAITPAVTCSAQATFTTGTLPKEHGIVGNGWYFRELAEVWLWRQSNHLVRGEMIWDAAKKRDPSFTCAKMFWWYNMYSSADFSVTPRPMYLADGRKLPDVYSHPAALRDSLQAELGTFPLFNFWGPRANIISSQWIADATMSVFEKQSPTLTMVYLPHLDYCLQKFGPQDDRIPAELARIDAVCAQLIEQARAHGARVIVHSEYGITPVDGPVHINRALREAGLVAVREQLGLELHDVGASDAFAVADHQIAHVYVKDSANIAKVKALLAGLDGVEQVLDRAEQARLGLNHERSGELVAISEQNRWFTYYYWLDDALAPDFARTVDIHKKPGYDPVEMFLDPKIAVPALTVGTKILKKKLGFRTLMDVIPLEAGLVKGSHGRVTDDPDAGPVLLSSEPGLLPDGPVASTGFKQLVLDHVFD